jgi:hypothetical protein
MNAALRERFMCRAVGAPSRPDCPPADEIWSAVSAELPRARLIQLLDHTAICPACAAAWRLARDLGADGAGAALPAWRAAEGPRAAWLPLAAAAALLLAAGLALQRLPDWRPGLSGSASTRSSAMTVVRSLIAEGGTLPREACLLRWSEGPKGSRYAVRVLDADLNLIVRAVSLETTAWQVPPAELASLPSGTRLFWQVDVALPEGGRAVSPTWSIRLD